MKFLKTIRIIGTFYKSFLLASVLVTACCLGLFWQYGFSIFAVIFWLKAATLAVTFYFINKYKSKEYYYYQNLGLSKALLWGTIIAFDFSLFILLIIQLYKFK
ncbi:MAG: hypothetical protein ABJB86_14910 [Bacteroidota bacterium]